jgi:cytochrome o ubiquinol oxidase operon protein cyoD
MPTLKSYTTGFIFSVILTLAAYFAVVNNVSNWLAIILVLAVLQVFIQLIFFLHINKGSDRGLNGMVFISTISIILILVIGSLWIMNHLNYNMTPGDMNASMMHMEGMQK